MTAEQAMDTLDIDADKRKVYSDMINKWYVSFNINTDLKLGFTVRNRTFQNIRNHSEGHKNFCLLKIYADSRKDYQI